MIKTTKKDLDQVIKIINKIIQDLEKEKKQNKAN
jgi:hypothetical protein